MSRIGKKHIDIPEGVQVNFNQGLVTVKSKKGELNYTVPEGIDLYFDNDNKRIILQRNADNKAAKSLHGLARSLIHNMVQGVSQEYEKQLQIVGTGYRVQLKGDNLIFAIGYSHQVEYQLPIGVTALVDDKQSNITLKSIDKHLIGQTAAEIKMLRFPDAYKGKGIRYINERLKLKAGKTGKK